MLPPEAPHGRRPAEPAARALTRLGAAAAMAAIAFAVAACGSDTSTTGASDGGIELNVTLDADGKGGDPERFARISCEPPACPAGAADLTADDFEPVAPDVACTEIYGGPDRVTIAGTLDGETVEAELTRANGCEIERFDRFDQLLRSVFPGYEPGASLAP
jgi:hypothetical protein